MWVNIKVALFLDVGDGNWNLLLRVFYCCSACVCSFSCSDVSITSEIGHGMSEDRQSFRLDVPCIKLLQAESFSAEYCVSLIRYLACHVSFHAVCYPYIASICYRLGVIYLDMQIFTHENSYDLEQVGRRGSHHLVFMTSNCCILVKNILGWKCSCVSNLRFSVIENYIFDGAYMSFTLAPTHTWRSELFW
jgi:hypothetical protein